MTACHAKGKWLVIHKTGRVRIYVTMSRLRVTLFAVEKHYYILRMCVFSLSYPACNVACLAAPYFSTLSHKPDDFRKKIIELKMRDVIVSATFS